MSAHEELLAAVKDARKIRQQYAATPDREQGAAAEAIARAEATLAQQNSASSQLDLQVITAILNAHLNAVEGSQALTQLQHDTEAAVRTRSDLDTPAGARDFQRFLIGKLRDIRAVVLNASLDDTSKSALMAAWTSLYDASKSHPNGPDNPAPAAPADEAAGAPTDDPEWDPLLDSLLADDPGLATDEVPASDAPAAGSAPATPIAPEPPPMMPSFAPGVPSFGGAPTGLPFPGLQGDGTTDPALEALDDGDLQDADHTDPKIDAASDEPGDENDDAGQDAAVAEGDPPPAAPTTVTLPDGETVTAANPQLAAAIKAAVDGTAIPDAFQQQGITIPPPGTAVTNPIDASRVTPADIGMFIDRHALALGPGKALLDGQIQDIATVSGPSFLGWEHPPAPAAAATVPAKPDTPTPTRPASSSTT